MFAFAALVWCAFTWTFDGFLVWSIAKQWQASSYAQTTGTITHAGVKRTSGRNSHDVPDVHYAYEVVGQRYENDRLRYDSDLADTQQTVAKYPLQSNVTVHYNPRSPGDAVLEVGVNPVGILGAALMLTPFNAAALGFAGWLWMWLHAWWTGWPLVPMHVRRSGLEVRVRIYETSPALVVLTGIGFGTILGFFAAALLTLVIPMLAALIVGWCVALTLLIAAWRHHPHNYVEFRRDPLQGIIEVRRGNGTFQLAPGARFQSFFPKPSRRYEHEEGEPPRFALELRFEDVDRRTRKVTLSTSATAEESARVVEWLNKALELPAKGLESRL